MVCHTMETVPIELEGPGLMLLALSFVFEVAIFDDL